MEATILIAEGHPDVANDLRGPLRRAGWAVLTAGDASTARRLLFASDRVGRVELVIIGPHLPGSDPRELCREIRTGAGPPVILVGDREHEGALIAGLALGADDYVLQPVRTVELVARVGAALRRARATPRRPPSRIDVGPLSIDPATRLATVDGEPLTLTPREYAVLLALALRGGEVITRDELLTTVWGAGWVGTPKVLDVQIGSLRRKLAAAPGRPSLIRTVRGVGFVIAPREPDNGERA